MQRYAPHIRETSGTAASSRHYTFDVIGNRSEHREGPHTTTLPANDNYSANALNQYTLVPNYTPQPVHDLDGNLTRGPIPGPNSNLAGVQTPTDATAIQWDAENRMISCTFGASTFLYEYDHLSRLHTLRSGSTAYRRYHYDGWNRIAEFTDTALLDTFTWGLDLSGTLQGAGGVGGLLATRWVSAVGSPTYFPTFDGNGNVSEYLTTTGTLAVHYEYDPFGTLTRLTGSTSTRYQYRFSTKPRNFNTGLYYYLYRWYDAPNARWLSEDPIGEQGGLNLYGFVSNDSINLLDPIGNQIFSPSGSGWPSYQPSPKPSKWPQQINPEVYENNQWHHSLVSVTLISCCCETQVMIDKSNKMLTAFSEFNSGQNSASIEISANGKSAGFTPTRAFDRFRAPFGGLSETAGVTLSGPGAGYAQEATTNGFHPLVGKRRWGTQMGITLGPCSAITIWTEAYESMNNWAGAGGKGFRGMAIKMWTKYLNGIADRVLKDCPGERGKESVTESGPDGVPATPLPW